MPHDILWHWRFCTPYCEKWNLRRYSCKAEFRISCCILMSKNVCEPPHFYRTGCGLIALNPALKVGPNKIHVQTNTESVQCMPLTSLSRVSRHLSSHYCQHVHCRTSDTSTDFIFCPMLLCIALDIGQTMISSAYIFQVYWIKRCGIWQITLLVTFATRNYFCLINVFNRQYVASASHTSTRRVLTGTVTVVHNRV